MEKPVVISSTSCASSPAATPLHATCSCRSSPSSAPAASANRRCAPRPQLTPSALNSHPRPSIHTPGSQFTPSALNSHPRPSIHTLGPQLTPSALNSHPRPSTHTLGPQDERALIIRTNQPHPLSIPRQGVGLRRSRLAADGAGADGAGADAVGADGAGASYSGEESTSPVAEWLNKGFATVLLPARGPPAVTT
eukprot:1189722-Prorocentrum_minimum.AAC.7